MKFFLKQTIYLLPIFLMGVSFLSVIIPWLGLKFDWVLWGNLGGYSLVTNVLFFYIFYYGNYCKITRLLPIGFFAATLINILGVYFPKYYKIWYEIVIFVVILTSLLIHELHRKIYKKTTE